MNKQTFEYWYENKFSLKQRIKEPHLKELLKDTWEEAYIAGYEDGRAEGYNDGHEDGFVVGHDEGYEEGIRSVEEE